jgi:AraC-like DNA-binding protein
VNEPIRTYSMAQRAANLDFGIRDEEGMAPIQEPHRHEYFQIQVNVAGPTRQHIGATVRPFEPGTLSFVLPYRVHWVPHPLQSRFFVINFSQRFLRPELDVDPLDLEDVTLDRAPELAPFRFQEFLDFRLDDADFETATGLCRSMRAEDAARRFYSLELIRASLLQLLGLVCRRYEFQLLPLAAAQAQHAGRRDALGRVVRYVRENLAAKVTLTDAAAAAHLSPNYLAHLLKKETGKTLTDLVTERRMEKAQALLANTGLRINEIAAAVGFEDEAYFTRRFRQLFDVSPRDYRSKRDAHLA